jgi:hypothetical protein
MFLVPAPLVYCRDKADTLLPWIRYAFVKLGPEFEGIVEALKVLTVGNTFRAGRE